MSFPPKCGLCEERGTQLEMYPSEIGNGAHTACVAKLGDLQKRINNEVHANGSDYYNVHAEVIAAMRTFCKEHTITEHIEKSGINKLTNWFDSKGIHITKENPSIDYTLFCPFEIRSWSKF